MVGWTYKEVLADTKRKPKDQQASKPAAPKRPSAAAKATPPPMMEELQQLRKHSLEEMKAAAAGGPAPEEKETVVHKVAKVFTDEKMEKTKAQDIQGDGADGKNGDLHFRLAVNPNLRRKRRSGWCWLPPPTWSGGHNMYWYRSPLRSCSLALATTRRQRKR